MSAFYYTVLTASMYLDTLRELVPLGLCLESHHANVPSCSPQNMVKLYTNILR